MNSDSICCERHTSIRAVPTTQDLQRRRQQAMHVVMAAAEAIPFAKTGGLADVCGTLPLQLAEQGHHCSIFIPAYKRALACGLSFVDAHVTFVVDMAGHSMAARILKTTISNGSAKGKVDVYLVDQPRYFDREQLYGDERGDFRDNCERFCFFSRCVVEAIERLRIPVDIIHCHDWQAGLIPAYHKTNFRDLQWYKGAASVMTIHNLAYQGRCWQPDMALTGLDWQYFNWQQMEFFGDMNLLKTGIAFADFVTTVSPSYAMEIQTPVVWMARCEFGAIESRESSTESTTLYGTHVATFIWRNSLAPTIGRRARRSAKQICNDLLVSLSEWMFHSLGSSAGSLNRKVGIWSNRCWSIPLIRSMLNGSYSAMGSSVSPKPCQTWRTADRTESRFGWNFPIR
jgi:hypothetical protein